MRCQAAFDTLFVVVVLTVGVRAQSNAPDPASSRLSHRPAPSDSCSCCPPREQSRSVQDVIRDALAILPEQPAYVSVIDVDAQEDSRVRQALRPLEAFTLPGKPGVYVSLHGATLRRLLESRDERFYSFDVRVLAAMVWHEMAHLAGADEPAAQTREEQLWKGFMNEGCVDPELALRQMQIYVSRRPR